MTDKALAERLRKLAQAYRSVVVVDVTSINEATDLERAADLIDSMAQRELVECTACGAEVVRVPGKYDRQNTIAADELPQILREYGRACERAAYERAAQVAGKTVCDRHIPTGVTIYGTAAAAAIRKLGAEK